MSSLDGHVRDYLALRRASGFKLDEPARVLVKFAAYLDQAEAASITTELAVSFAQIPTGVQPIHWAHRLSAIRGFARYMALFDEATEIPPDNIFAARQQRPTPYLWAKPDIARLLDAAREIRPRCRAATFETLFGLLAVSGMRISEALNLNDNDVDLDTGVLTINNTKFDRARLVPLHPTTTETLRVFITERDRHLRTSSTNKLFRSKVGTALAYPAVLETFITLSTTIGVRTDITRPRMHDLRHGFAVQTMIDWHRAGIDIDTRISVLSNYLGHVNPAGTYWYLSAVPELMELAAARLDLRFGAAP